MACAYVWLCIGPQPSAQRAECWKRMRSMHIPQQSSQVSSAEHILAAGCKVLRESAVARLQLYSLWSGMLHHSSRHCHGSIAIQHWPNAHHASINTFLRWCSLEAADAWTMHGKSHVAARLVAYVLPHHSNSRSNIICAKWEGSITGQTRTEADLPKLAKTKLRKVVCLRHPWR